MFNCRRRDGDGEAAWLPALGVARIAWMACSNVSRVCSPTKFVAMLSVAAVKNCLGHAAHPVRIHAVVELVHVNSRLLAIIGKARLILREEMADQIHVRVIVHADAEDGETVRRIFLRQLDEHRILVAARLAPCGPEGHQQRLALVLRENAIVSGHVNEREFHGGS